MLLWLVAAAPIGYPVLTPPYSLRADLLALCALLVLTAAVGVSRRLPVAALVIVVLGSLFNGNFLFAIPVFSYLAGRRSVTAAPAAVAFAAIAAGGTVLNLGLLGAGAGAWFLLASTLLFAGVVPWLVGRYRRQQYELGEAARRHAEASAREARGVAERIRLRERARIAEEMHDSLGHDLSLIALRAAALQVAVDLEPRHRAAAGELRASVAAATERLHEIIGLLREEERPSSTRPAGESVAELVEGAREAGMAVRLLADPGPAELPARVRHAVHRTVREALTNAARYAPGAEADVRLTRAGDRIEVTVVNARPPAGPLPGPPSHGSGLLALAERVRLLGGSFDARPQPEGGFAVRAVLPLTAPTGLDATAPATAEERTGPSADPERPGAQYGPEGRSPAYEPVGQAAGAESPARGERAGEAEQRLRAARRRVRRSLLAAFGAPAGLALLLGFAYYAVATAGTVLHQATYDAMRVGALRTELTGLPSRHLGAPAGVDPAGCEYYTDGNFPLAQPTWRLCFADGRLISKERINQ